MLAAVVLRVEPAETVLDTGATYDAELMPKWRAAGVPAETVRAAGIETLCATHP
ncbi:hypothetical protein [Streptomyces goshikiensis]|uniref:hypothetical protein n=1 Tax=Streptomyces goshikiensis TaxID=1942 RepID=UPI003657800D